MKPISLLDIRASFKVIDDFFNIPAFCSPSNAGSDRIVLFDVDNGEFWLMAFLILATFAK